MLTWVCATFLQVPLQLTGRLPKERVSSAQRGVLLVCSYLRFHPEHDPPAGYVPNSYPLIEAPSAATTSGRAPSLSRAQPAALPPVTSRLRSRESQSRAFSASPAVMDGSQDTVLVRETRGRESRALWERSYLQERFRGGFPSAFPSPKSLLGMCSEDMILGAAATIVQP